ncbi:MAG: FlgD immunoglobulin-like domain containing protein, partial [Candidatus Cloacimonadaceae bacterium]|nr:FlgD immunoglobulin-like domain containing protein [Candidatus Cloacimonadaceae bacterium]
MNYIKMILLIAVMALWSTAHAQFGGGAGTLASPYQIATAAHLNNIRGVHLDKYFIQTSDIDLSAYGTGFDGGKGWIPIGTASDPFRGVYDGNGKLISNLYINRGASPIANNLYPTDGEDAIGLFGFVSNGSPSVEATFDVIIKNLGLLNPNVTGRRGTGSLVGRVLLPHTLPARSFTVIIERCYAKASAGTATVRGLGAVGGLVGANNSNAKQRVPIIRYSHAIVTVSSTHPNNIARNPNDPTGTTGINNPYNIKYGGLVGCNENGITLDSFARGNVSGGDRVGGLAGCTIGGSIYRSYSTGTVAQGIVPGDWEGGIGGLVGRTSGTLPPGLGGTNSTGSCEDCFWDVQTSGIATSPGGTGKTTLQMKTQSTFTNWDFVNVWGIDAGINDGYPYLRGNANAEFYYRTKQSGLWNATGTWEYSADNAIWNNAVVTPDAANSLGITILATHTVTISNSVIINQTLINSGGKVLVNNAQSLGVTNGAGTDLIVNGILDVSGSLIPEISSSIVFGTGSKLVYSGLAAQSTGTYFLFNVYDLEINNAAGVTFTNPIQVNNVLSVLDGFYSGATVTDGYYSPGVNYIEIDPSSDLIAGFSLSMSTPALLPNFVNREWVITGTYSGNKQITFYWTDTDDGNFPWSLSLEPAVFKGVTKYLGVYDVSGSTRSITIIVPSSMTRGTWTIGRSDEQTLPVELSSFTANINATNNVTLQWVTQTESNLIGYRVYRHGSPDLMQATLLNDLVQATNTSQMQIYVYTDSEVYDPGTYYYWLESLEFGGSNQFFGPISILVNPQTSGTPALPIQNGIIAMYPNPFNPNVTLSYAMIKDAEVRIGIYNSRGQLVRSLHSGALPKGTHSVNWDGRNDNGSQASSG